MRLDREQWQRVRPLFDELVDLAPDARRARMASIRDQDPALADALVTLLAADVSADDALTAYQFGLRRSEKLDSAAETRDPLGIIGRTVSHFRVTDYVAAGGMGVVYTADDLELGRVVALKFPLPHQQMDRTIKERFVQEARSVAALDHPNLCTVYQVGESSHGVFLAMPLYAGETLKERLARERRLSPAEALGIIRQVSTGLVSAHAAGIVHRDLKPGNVMLLSDGSVKILDFGLAKVRDATITRSHRALGTIGYMAPDQIGGGRTDERADLWSVGVMLYEMLTGVQPFRGDHELAVLHAILNDDPLPPSRVGPDLPRGVDALVAALLQKNPLHRYPSAVALLADIAALERGGVPAHRTPFWTRSRSWRKLRKAVVAVAMIAVLVASVSLAWSVSRFGDRPAALVPTASRKIAVFPFVNAGSDAAQDYRASGLTDDLIALMGRVPGIDVAARPLVSALRQQGLAPRGVGERLGLTHVVDGMIRVVADTLHLSTRLTRVADDALVWTGEFTAPVAEVPTLARQVADSLLTALEPRIAHGVAVTALPTSDPEAYDLYLRGRFTWNQAPRTREQLEQSLVYYRSALERDPDFALAHSGMAMAYVNMANFGYMPASQALARAEVAGSRALALDSSLHDAYTARGFVLAARGSLSAAEASLRRAIALNASSPWSHHFLALVLTMTGRLDEAIDATRRTLAIDPLSLAGNTMLGIEFATAGELEEARAQLRRALELAPEFPLTLYYLGTVEAALGNDEAARDVLERALRTAPDFPGVRAALALTYERMRRTTEARQLLEAARSAVKDERTRVNYALALALLGPTDSAFAMLQTAEWDIPTLIELRSNPLLREFRADPRYPELLVRSSLAP